MSGQPYKMMQYSFNLSNSPRITTVFKIIIVCMFLPEKSDNWFSDCCSFVTNPNLKKPNFLLEQELSSSFPLNFISQLIQYVWSRETGLANLHTPESDVFVGMASSSITFMLLPWNDFSLRFCSIWSKHEQFCIVDQNVTEQTNKKVKLIKIGTLKRKLILPRM